MGKTKRNKKTTTEVTAVTDTPARTTRSQTEGYLDSMFFEMDENGHVKEGNTFVPAGGGSSRNTKTTPQDKKNLQFPQSIMKNTNASNSSRSTHSVTFDKSVKLPKDTAPKVRVPSMVKTSSPTTEQVQKLPRGTRRGTRSNPEEQQGTPTSEVLALPASTKNTSGMIADSATGNTPAGKVDVNSMSIEQIRQQINFWEEQAKNKSTDGVPSDVANGQPKAVVKEGNHDVSKNQDQTTKTQDSAKAKVTSVIVETVTSPQEDAVTEPDAIVDMLTAPPVFGSDEHLHDDSDLISVDSAIPDSLKEQVRVYNDRLKDIFASNVDGDDPVPYVDLTLQSGYSPGSVDTVIQSNKIRATLGNEDRTMKALMEVIADSNKDSPKNLNPLLRPSHFGSNVHSAAGAVPLNDLPMYRMLHKVSDNRVHEIGATEADILVAEAQAARLEAERLAELKRRSSFSHRMWSKMTPSRLAPPPVPNDPILPDPKPTEDLKKLRENQKEEVWETFADKNYAPVTLDDHAVKVYNETKESIGSDVAMYYAGMPDDEFIPLMCQLGEQLIGEEAHMFIAPAYTAGAGLNLTFHNLGSYRSIHAHATTQYLKEAVRQFLPDLELLFFDTPLTKGALSMIRLAWFVREMPLATRHHLVNIADLHKRQPTSPSFAHGPRRIAFNMAMKSVSDAWDRSVSVNVNNRPTGRHPFDVGVAPTRQEYKARQGRIFLRTEPLQFPSLPPPHGRTHTHGRYILREGQAAPTWVDYTDQGQDHMFLLPPNVPKDPTHWEFRRLPNGVTIRSMNDLIAMVLNFKAAKGIPFNPIDPLGPALNQDLNQVLDGSNIDQVIWEKAEQITDDLTPVEYAPTHLMYRDLSPEEAAAVKALATSPDEGSDLTSSPENDKDKPAGTDVVIADTQPVLSILPAEVISKAKSDGLDPTLGGTSDDFALYMKGKKALGSDSQSSQKPNTLFPDDKTKTERLLNMDGPKEAGDSPSKKETTNKQEKNHDTSYPHFGKWKHHNGYHSKPGEWSADIGSPPNIHSSFHKGHDGSGGSGNGGGGGDGPTKIFSLNTKFPDPSTGGGGDNGSYGSGGHHSESSSSSSSKSTIPSKKVFAMKPEIKYFKNLESWDNFHEWFDDFVATCGGTGLHNHTDFEYIPTEEEKTYFYGLDRWLYVILKHRLQVTEGKDFLRREKATLSGRRVLFHLWKYSMSSAVADLSAEQRLVDITNMTLDTSWNKSATAFINKFVQEVEAYNSTCKTPQEEISEDMSMTLLQRAVIGVKSLADVKARERHAIAEGRGKFTLQQYLSLLKDEAGRVDRLRAKARGKRDTIGRRINNSRRPTRKINRSEIDERTEEDSVSSNDNETSDKNDDLQGMLEVFKVVMGDRAERMDNDSFGKLSPAGRKLWTQLTKEDRSTMLRSQPDGSRSVNLTELSSPEEEERVTDTDDRSDEERATPINMTEAQSNAKSKSHPADIRRSLSKSAAKKGAAQARSITNVHWSPVLEETEDDVLNELGELEEDEIQPNDDPLYEDSDDSDHHGNWPAFEGDIGDYWGESSDEEDFA